MAEQLSQILKLKHGRVGDAPLILNLELRLLPDCYITRLYACTQGQTIGTGACRPRGAASRSGGDRIGRGVHAASWAPRVGPLPALRQRTLGGDRAATAASRTRRTCARSAMITRTRRPQGFRWYARRRWQDGARPPTAKALQDRHSTQQTVRGRAQPSLVYRPITACHVRASHANRLTSAPPALQSP